MKYFKVVDSRKKYRNDPMCNVTRDTEEAFIVQQQILDEDGTTKYRTLILNPKNFREERIVDEYEATLLLLENPRVELKEIENV